MATPLSYSEIELATYMAGVAGEIVTILGWTASDTHFVEAVNEALLAFGADDISTITGADNIRKLRATARREIWRAIVAGLTSYHDYSAPDGQSLKESQLQTQAETALAQAEADCQALGVDAGGYAVGVTRVCYPDEPGTRYAGGHGEFGSWR